MCCFAQDRCLEYLLLKNRQSQPNFLALCYYAIYRFPVFIILSCYRLHARVQQSKSKNVASSFMVRARFIRHKHANMRLLSVRFVPLYEKYILDNLCHHPPLFQFVFGFANTILTSLVPIPKKYNIKWARGN